MRHVVLTLAVLALLFPAFTHAGEAAEPVTVYYNEACSDCGPYVRDVLLPTLRSTGFPDVTVKDYVNDRSARKEYVSRNEQLGIPLDLQAHLATFIGDRIVVGGHVPAELLTELLSRPTADLPTLLVVFQDEMPEMQRSGTPITYALWSPTKGEAQYVDRVDLPDYLARPDTASAKSERPLLPIVLSSGFLDGLNPCAFGVLLFFIAFLFTAQRSRRQIVAAGLLFTGAVFLAYLGIGLGLWKAVVLSTRPHLFAEIAAWLVIGLGFLNLLGTLVPRFPIRLKIPAFAKPVIQTWIHRTTLPAAFIAGFLVGLCTFPCSGGIYVAIVGLLAAKSTALTGFGYLGLYNLMFVLPLLLILGLATNPFVAGKLQTWQRSSARTLRIVLSATMVGLGLIILIYFV